MCRDGLMDLQNDHGMEGRGSLTHRGLLAGMDHNGTFHLGDVDIFLSHPTIDGNHCHRAHQTGRHKERSMPCLCELLMHSGKNGTGVVSDAVTDSSSSSF